MNLTSRTTVGEIAAAYPRAIPVLQRHGIDFCCGGGRALSEACVEKGVSYDALADELAAANDAAAELADAPVETLAALVRHIVERYHADLRAELPRLEALSDKVVAAHGARFPDTLPALRDALRSLTSELIAHMGKEEQVLFPYVLELERADQGGRPSPPRHLGLAAGAIGVMEREHEVAGLTLKTMRALTGGFRPPDGACGSFRALYAGLELLETDLHHHIHLENNVLFPRAVGLERRLREDRRIRTA